jgi:hypothetical protein
MVAIRSAWSTLAIAYDGGTFMDWSMGHLALVLQTRNGVLRCAADATVAA